MRKILVIEDKNSHLDCLNALLDSSVYSLHYSHDKDDGVEIALKYPQDVIVFLYSNSVDNGRIENLLNSSEVVAPIIIIAEQPSFDEQRKLMEMGVEDYIHIDHLKESLAKSLDNRLTRIGKMKQIAREQINDFDETGNKVKRDDHILVKIGTKLKLVKFSDIIYITAMKEYSKIKSVNSADVLVRKSMRNWIKILPKSFLRIHRATIINLDYIEKISGSSTRTYTVTLKGVKETFDFSYRYTNIMRRTFPS